MGDPSRGPHGRALAAEVHCGPTVRAHVSRRVEQLEWHGALSIDDLRDGFQGSERFVDVNPYLAEPGNAVLCGCDLATLLVRMALGEHVVVSHQE